MSRTHERLKITEKSHSVGSVSLIKEMVQSLLPHKDFYNNESYFVRKKCFNGGNLFNLKS